VLLLAGPPGSAGHFGEDAEDVGVHGLGAGVQSGVHITCHRKWFTQRKKHEGQEKWRESACYEGLPKYAAHYLPS